VQLRRLVAATLIGAAVVLVSASPEAAHGGGAGIEPTNYRPRVQLIDPRIAGLEVRLVELGDKVEVQNRTGREITVLGCEDELYLRVGPAASSATRALPPPTSTASANQAAPPCPNGPTPTHHQDWERVASNATVRWHDHRVHWMGSADPPAVQRAPRSRHGDTCPRVSWRVAKVSRGPAMR
jgi:hypothetical protein